MPSSCHGLLTVVTTVESIVSAVVFVFVSFSSLNCPSAGSGRGALLVQLLDYPLACGINQRGSFYYRLASLEFCCSGFFLHLMTTHMQGQFEIFFLLFCLYFFSLLFSLSKIQIPNSTKKRMLYKQYQSGSTISQTC